MKKIINLIQKEICGCQQVRVVVAVSGGPDSMALLSLLQKVDANIKIICAHVDHKVRQESINDRKFVQKYCEKNNLDFEYFDIENYTQGVNFHADARDQRYFFFDEMVKKYEARYLFTAHHGDDLLETILMRFTRGTTLKGMGGIKLLTERGSYKIFRPLLTVSKDELLNYCKENNINYRVDSSNDKDQYTRNRFRKTVVPFLKLENEQILDAVVSLSNEIYEVDKFIEQAVKYQYDNTVVNKTLSINAFKSLESLIQKRILLKWLRNNYGANINLITKKHIDQIFGTIFSDKPNVIIYLPENRKVIKSYDKLAFGTTEEIIEYSFTFDKSVNLPNGKNIEEVSSTTITNNDITHLNTKKLQLPLVVTNLDLNKKIQLKNSPFQKQINRILIDDKIPAEDRKKTPLVMDQTGVVVWIPGLKKSKYDVGNNGDYDIILRYY